MDEVVRWFQADSECPRGFVVAMLGKRGVVVVIVVVFIYLVVVGWVWHFVVERACCFAVPEPNRPPPLLEKPADMPQSSAYGDPYGEFDVT